MWDFFDNLFSKLLKKLRLSSKGDYKERLEKIKVGLIPNHIAMIMDGNGRWAKKKGLPRTAGHRAGVDNLKDIIEVAKELRIDFLTVYAFSTENWKRPQQEVDYLMALFEEVFDKELDYFIDNNIKVKIIGYKDRLSDKVHKKANQIMKKTEENKDITVNVALDYGGRAEIIKVAKELCQEYNKGELNFADIDEELFSKRLYTVGQAEVDLLIRPGGESRISNFLLWQLAYSELYFSDIYWPDFNEDCFLDAIVEYQNRERRFGGLKKSR